MNGANVIHPLFERWRVRYPVDNPWPRLSNVTTRAKLESGAKKR